MIKRFFVVGTIALLGLSTFLVSCDKEKDEEPLIGCSCIEQFRDSGQSYIETYNYTLGDMQDYGATTCDQLAKNIKTFTYAYDNTAIVRCTELR